jgi:hypothetical protein
VQSEQLASWGGEGRQLRRGDAVCDGRICLVDGEHGPGDLGAVHAAERHQVSASVDDRRRHQDGSARGFGMRAGDDAQRRIEVEGHRVNLCPSRH